MIDWHSVDTVLLDMDGTLLDLEFDNWFWQKHVPECYARQQGLDRAEADRIIHDWITSHLGTLNWYCLDFWTAELGLEIARLKREAGDRIAVRPGADTFWCHPAGPPTRNGASSCDPRRQYRQILRKTPGYPASAPAAAPR